MAGLPVLRSERAAGVPAGQRHFGAWRRRLGFAVVVLLGLAGTRAASAQSVTEVSWARGATLSGYIVDETQAVLTGVSIRAMNTQTGTTRDARSGGDGWFLMPLLPAGAYVITVEQEGFAPLEVRDVQLGATDYLVLRIPLRVRGVGESVTVNGNWSALDLDAVILPPSVGQWVQGVRVGGELQRRLPLTRDRGYADAVLLAPSVITQLGTHYVHGVAGDAAVVLLDGVDVSSALVGGVDRLRLSQEAIESVEVRTAGMDASIPLSQGALISIVTKSGTNQVRGSGTGQARARGWMAVNDPLRQTRSSLLQAEAAIGGPVARDRWWFFGSYRAGAAGADPLIVPTLLAQLRSVAPEFEPPDSSSQSQVFFVKPNGRFSPRHDVGGFFQRDARSTRSWGGSFYVGAGPEQFDGGNAYSARVSSVWSDSLMTRVSAAYNDKTSGKQVHVPVSGTYTTVFRGMRQVPGYPVGEDALAVLNPAANCCNSHPARKLTFTADLTWYRKGAGSHELQVGAFLQPYLRLGSEFDIEGLVSEDVVLRDPTDPAAGFRTFRRTTIGRVKNQYIHSQDEAVYVQDTWRPSSWMTIGLGLRADWIEDRDEQHELIGRRTWAIGPRLSLALQPAARDTIRVGWGRIHESPTASRIQYPFMSTWARKLEYDADLDGVFETVMNFDETVMADSDYVDLERGQPYVNELTLGYRRQLPWHLSVDLGFTARDYRDIPVTTTGWTAYNGQGRLVYVTGGVPRIVANTWNYPVVRDLTLLVTRQTAAFQLAATYNRNWRRVEGTWAPGDPAGTLQPSAFDNDRGFGGVRHGEANSLSGQADIETAGWADHAAIVAGAYIGPRGITVAASYRVQSGIWSGPVVTMAGEPPDPTMFPSSPAYSSANLRFAYATRGDGQLQLPTVHELNLRLGLRRTTRWGRFEPSIDIFNVFNAATYISWDRSAHQLYSASYGRPASMQSPRSVVGSLRFVF